MKNKTNELLINRIGFSDVKEIDSYRKIYKNIMDKFNEEDFYASMISWWNEGNAPYYDNYLKRVWKD